MRDWKHSLGCLLLASSAALLLGATWVLGGRLFHYGFQPSGLVDLLYVIPAYLALIVPGYLLWDGGSTRRAFLSRLSDILFPILLLLSLPLAMGFPAIWVAFVAFSFRLKVAADIRTDRHYPVPSLTDFSRATFPLHTLALVFAVFCLLALCFEASVWWRAREVLNIDMSERAAQLLRRGLDPMVAILITGISLRFKPEWAKSGEQKERLAEGAE